MNYNQELPARGGACPKDQHAVAKQSEHVDTTVEGERITPQSVNPLTWLTAYCAADELRIQGLVTNVTD
jgi:hypothetical protein